MCKIWTLAISWISNEYFPCRLKLICGRMEKIWNFDIEEICRLKYYLGKSFESQLEKSVKPKSHTKYLHRWLCDAKNQKVLPSLFFAQCFKNVIKV